MQSACCCAIVFVSMRRRSWLRLALLAIVACIAYALWSPGERVTDGRHDRGRNAIWMGHGWLGHDDWFVINEKTAFIPNFRRRERLEQMARVLRVHHVADVFPISARQGRMAALLLPTHSRWNDF